MKKILSGLLTVCLLVSMLAVADTPIKAEAASTSGSLEQRITQLQKKFPNGKYWNHSGSFVNNPDGWTDKYLCSIVWQRDIRGSAAVTVFLMRSSVWDFQKNSVMMCSEVHQEPGLAIRTCQK